MAQPVQPRTVSSIADVNAAVQSFNIQTIKEATASQLQFEVHQKTPLKEAYLISRRTRPGRTGIRVLNPELLDCKMDAKLAIDLAYEELYNASTTRYLNDLAPVEAAITLLRTFMARTDEQIPNVGPGLVERNQGIQHRMYPHPPFGRYPSNEFDNHQRRVPYQPPFEPVAVVAAGACDKLAQRAIYDAKLKFLLARKDVLEKSRVDMERTLKEVYDSLMTQPSNLGCGYANLEEPPFA